MIKPDGVNRRLIGEIIHRYEQKGLKLIGLKMQLLTRELAERHYESHRGQPYFEPLIKFMTSGPVILMVWEGYHAISVARQLNGATDALVANLGTIRGDFGLTNRFNLVHASDSQETAEKEIRLYFSENELISYTMPDQSWLQL